ncbi:MAG: phospho-N-acetylmuramoyl-pentapeptide-transferase [Coriobacteriia bacterium]|nr:phospho-N-acetylmuramoyl-pentapeptide-transferase [Coriobacteriia bacterium]
MFDSISSYPTFVVFLTCGMATVICMVLMPIWKRILKASHIGQQVRADGPETHLIKQGTPTMGGVMMLIAMLVTLLIIGIWRPEEIALVIAVFAAGLLGFIDDSAKVLFHRSLGLGAISKLVCQFAISTAFVLYAVNMINISPVVTIPFIIDIDLGVLTSTIAGVSVPWLYVILIDLLIVGMCNAVNLTDGLDGLATGSSMIVMLVMAAIAFRCNSLGSSIVAAALAGACLGFLWHNCHPADIFMGDTGSLALGMALGCLAVLTKTEFISIIIGGLYVIEALSVLIQVGYYKKTKKRIFLMSPLHHHFEKKGWSETKVVIRFWMISGAFAAAGFVLFFATTIFN